MGLSTVVGLRGCSGCIVKYFAGACFLKLSGGVFLVRYAVYGYCVDALNSNTKGWLQFSVVVWVNHRPLATNGPKQLDVVGMKGFVWFLIACRGFAIKIFIFQNVSILINRMSCAFKAVAAEVARGAWLGKLEIEIKKVFCSVLDS